MLSWSSGATLHTDCHRFTQPENQKYPRNQFEQDLEGTLYLEVEALPSHLGVCHLFCTSTIKAHPCCFKYVVQGFTCMFFLLPIHWVAPFSCFLTSSLKCWDSLFLHCPVVPDLPYFHLKLTLFLFFLLCSTKLLKTESSSFTMLYLPVPGTVPDIL